MSFYVRTDKVKHGRRKRRLYYWLVESHRESKNLIQRRVKYLGTRKPSHEALMILKINQNIEEFLNAYSTGIKDEKRGGKNGRLDCLSMRPYL